MQPIPKSSASMFEGREDVRADFLSKQGWNDAKGDVIAEDWASRRYWRLHKDGQSRILLESLPDTHPQATPGHKISDTVRIGEFLTTQGVHVPEIYAHDIEGGYALLEDLGDVSYARALTEGADEQELYLAAADALKAMQKGTGDNALNLPEYADSHVNIGKRRIIDWYVPLCRDKKVEEGTADAFLKLFEDIESALPPCPKGFVHCDYHADNLMWLAGAQGLVRVGVLDYQGALFGPAPYDLTNLLEDIRRDVDEDVKASCYAAFCKDMSAEERQVFDVWYKLLALQFHCRLAGQVIRIFKFKQSERYLQYLPRIQRYLREELKHPEFLDVRVFLQEQGCDLDKDLDVTLPRLQSLVSEGAF
jgi:aminoglycoside/choline kinase family phosphotransferase